MTGETSRLTVLIVINDRLVPDWVNGVIDCGGLVLGSLLWVFGACIGNFTVDARASDVINVVGYSFISDD